MADNVGVTEGGDREIATDEVAGINYQRVKLVDGTLDSTQAIPGDAANGLDVDVTRVQGTVHVDDNSGSLTVDSAQLPGALAGSGALKVDQQSALPTGTNTVGKVDQGAGGASAWKTDGSATTQPVSASSLPLPTGAATETTLAAIKTDVDKIPASPAQEHATAVSPSSVRLSDGAAFYKGTTPSDTQPVSAASLPLPSGASTESTLSTVSTEVGGVTETAPATDTASSGLNGRLQRIAQRLTSIIALLPASIGKKATTGSMSVTLASDDTLYSVLPSSLGQKDEAHSFPVVLPSDQSVTISGDITVAASSGNVDTNNSFSQAVTAGSTSTSGAFTDVLNQGTTAIVLVVSSAGGGNYVHTPIVDWSDDGVTVRHSETFYWTVNLSASPFTALINLPVGGRYFRFRITNNAAGTLTFTTYVIHRSMETSASFLSPTVSPSDGARASQMRLIGAINAYSNDVVGDALADGISNTQSLLSYGSRIFPFVYNGTTWDRLRGGTGGLDQNLKQLNGTTVDTNSGTKSAGTQRVVLATDQPALTNALDQNLKNLAGTTIDTNSGTKSAGTQRVVLATDQPALTNALKVDGSAVAQPVTDNGGSLTVDGTVAASEAKAEDAASVSGDNGVPQLAVRRDTPAAETSTDGDYTIPTADSFGAQYVHQRNGAIEGRTVKVATASSTANTSFSVVAAVASKKIRVIAMLASDPSANPIAISFQDASGGTTLCTLALLAHTTIAHAAPPGAFLFETTAGNALFATTADTNDRRITVTYIEV